MKLDRWTKTVKTEEIISNTADWWTERAATAASNRRGKRRSCRKVSCIVSAGGRKEVRIRWWNNVEERTYCPRAGRRHVDSPRLLLSLMLFSCSCSNRTVNNNSSSREKQWLTGTSWLDNDNDAFTAHLRKKVSNTSSLFFTSQRAAISFVGINQSG